MVRLEDIGQFLKLCERLLARHDGPICNKTALQRYTGFGETLLDECIRAGLPCFKISGTIISHTAAVDEWLNIMSKKRLNVSKEGDQKEEPE